MAADSLTAPVPDGAADSYPRGAAPAGVAPAGARRRGRMFTGAWPMACPGWRCGWPRAGGTCRAA